MLLDTHTLIWAAGEVENIPAATREVMAEADLMVSPVSAYEMNLKHASGKLPNVAAFLPILSAYLASLRIDVLPISLAHAQAAGRLPLTHRDPFDRILAAQALAEDLTLVSRDRKLDQFGVRRLW